MSPQRRAEALLVTDEVAELLQVHPKQVYRLLARGLPGRRVGREWRFDREEVLRWVGGGAIEREEPPQPGGGEGSAPSIVAANGDVAVELLLSRMAEVGPPMLGFLQADRDGALAWLRRGLVLLAGCHGREPPRQVGEDRLARIHLVQREVGLVGPPGGRAPAAADLAGLRLAARPGTAGIRLHLEAALREVGLSTALLDGATLHASHRDVVHAVARGEADAGLATRAWAWRLGLPFRALATEAYGLVVRAADLGDPRVVRLCEVAQGPPYRAALAEVPGYDARDSGAVQYHFSS